jgi:predicted acetyltransferase
MMRRQLREVRDAGREPVAVLWASEGRIYPRFGYGLAAQRLSVTVATRELDLTVPQPGPLRSVDPAASWKTFAAVYERVRAERSGLSGRDETWWRFVLGDPPARRHDATPLKAAVFDGPSGPLGYAVWRTRSGWRAHGPAAQVEVREVMAADPAAHAALWRLLLTIDLTRELTYDFLPVDDPLIHLVDEPRRLGAAHSESLWVRLVDLPAALSTRRYPTDVDVVLDVQDALLAENTGRWRLTGGPSGATCTPSTDPAGLTCDIRDLGAAYLGGTSLAALAAAGRVRELIPGTLRATSIAFGWHRLPAAAEVF